VGNKCELIRPHFILLVQIFITMKKTNLALLALIITLAISSCSQRYSYLSRVKADSPKQETLKSSKYRVNEMTSKTFTNKLQASKDLVASIETKNNVVAANTHLEEVATILAETVKTAKASKINKSVAKKLNKLNTLVNERVLKVNDKSVTQNPTKTNVNIDGVKWMIAGLILILAGAILNFVLGGIGITIGGIGGLVFLIGLIFFLLDYLK